MSDDPCIASALRDAARRASDAYSRALAPSGLNVAQYRLLAVVAAADGPPAISDLARRLNLDRSTLGRNLRVLERAGLVAFEAGEDERARLVTTTEAGLSALERARPLWAGAQAQARAEIGSADASRLLAFLNRVAPEG